MGDRSKIEWTDASWTPIRARWFAPANDGGSKERIGWHCEHVSEGCRNCYAESLNLRLGTGLPFKPDHRRREITIPPSGGPTAIGEMRGDVTVFLDEKMLLQPLRWRRPRRIFVCSTTDLFADFVTDEMIDRVFGVMALCPQHTFQILTKRPDRMRAYVGTWFERLATIDPLFTHPSGAARFSKLVDWSVLPTVLPNVWMGVSAEDQGAADTRIPDLLETPAAVRFVSAEPLLGSIDFTSLDPDGTARPYGAHGWSAIWRDNCVGRVWLDWIIVGGESGPHARPMHPQWARDIRDQCAAAGVGYYFKQWGEWAPAEDWYADHPVSLQLRAFNEGRWREVSGSDEEYVARIGKKAAGRLLDGVEHNGMPEVRP